MGHLSLGVGSRANCATKEKETCNSEEAYRDQSWKSRKPSILKRVYECEQYEGKDYHENRCTTSYRLAEGSNHYWILWDDVQDT